jgi:hypothetical protein
MTAEDARTHLQHALTRQATERQEVVAAGMRAGMRRTARAAFGVKSLNTKQEEEGDVQLAEHSH